MSQTRTIQMAPTVSSYRPTDYIFVEVKTKETAGPISRGAKISHALRKHHREARRDRARKHLASQSLDPKFRHEVKVVSFRNRPSSTPDSILERLGAESVKDEEQDAEAIGFQVLHPGALMVAIGQGRLDPFNVYPEEVGMYVHEVLD